MLSNVKITLKSLIPTSYGTGDTFTIFETGIEVAAASVVFSSKTKLERFQVDIANTGVCTIVLRGLDNTEIKTEVAELKEERDIGANGYITLLASDIFDKDATSPQTLNSPFIFNGAIEMKDGLDVEGETNLEDLAVTGKSSPIPVVADETARDALYPTPVTGDMANVGGEVQKYNTSSGQWETLDVGTPVPNATEVLRGKARLATEVEALDGTDDETIMTPAKVKSAISNDKSTLSNSDFMTGEDLVQGDSLFVEDAVTFASATNSQNIGDVTANTRVAIRAIGSGVAASTLKLALAKAVSPSANLGIRIETDNLGEPSGTLIDANATSTVLASGLTTSLEDTTATLAGSITIPEGDIVWIILFAGTYGSETVNSTNYYNVGYSVKNTSTRYGKLRDGSVWNGGVYVIGSNVNDAHSISMSTTNSGTEKRGYKIANNKAIQITSIVKRSSCNATKGYILDSSQNVLYSASFVGDVCTFTGANFPNIGTALYVCVDNDGAPYTSYYSGAGTGYPISRTNINYTGFLNQQSNIISVNSVELSLQLINFRAYISSSLFEQHLLSKTDADYTYKLPDMPRIATDSYSAGELVKYDFQGITKVLSGLTKDSLYYASNTPGALSLSAGTNVKPIGLALTTSQLNLIDDGYLGTATLNNGQQSYTVPTGTYRIECYVINYTHAGVRYQEGYGVISPYQQSFTLREAESNSTINAYTKVTLASGVATLTATTIESSSAVLKFYNK